MNISAVIIAKDASKTIAQTLESLKPFEEVIVYDTGSVDNTIEIAQRYKNTVIYRKPFAGFGESKNKAAALAKNDWILSIDADEVVGPKLLASIQKLHLNDSEVYRFKRYNYYRNQRIKYSGWGNEYVVRLYNRTKMCFNCKLVHENIETGDTEIVTLPGELNHYSYHSISDFVRKRDLYAELFAIENMNKRKTSPFMAFIRGAFDFLNTFLIKRGFLDGYRGLLIAVSNANVSFYKYLKLYEVNKSNDKRISLILNIDRNCKNLGQLFRSILMQTIVPAEIIILLDKSEKITTDLAKEFAKNSFIPVTFLDKEFSAVECLKSAIKSTENEYLIYLNSGAVLDRNFIFNHSQKAERSFFIEGKSLKLDKYMTHLVNNNQLENKSGYNLVILFHSILSWVFQKKSEPYNYNFSFFREDFSELFNSKLDKVANKSEKLEIATLLKNQGLRKKKLLFKCRQFVLNEVDREKSKLPKVLICLDRLKYLNCGLGQISLNLGRNLLLDKSEELSYSYLLPARGFAEFDSKIESIRLTILRNIFPRFMRKFDLCHVTHQLPQYDFDRARKKVLTIHDLNFIYTKSKRKSKRYLKTLQNNIYKADSIVFISEFTKSTCFDYLDIPETKLLKVIYNGVQPPEIDNNKPNWMPDGKFLFSIGQFLEKKNFHVLIPFIQLLPSDIILVIAGENNTHYGQKIKKLVIDNDLQNRVVLPGGISEEQKNFLYHHCLAYVFPSVAEGFGLPVIEAMLCNKPVFCSNRTSLKEIGGNYAFFWENFEPGYMVDIYNKGLNRFSDEYKKNQYEYAKTFTHSKNTNEYIKLYKELLNL